MLCRQLTRLGRCLGPLHGGVWLKATDKKQSARLVWLMEWRNDPCLSVPSRMRSPMGLPAEQVSTRTGDGRPASERGMAESGRVARPACGRQHEGKGRGRGRTDRAKGGEKPTESEACGRRRAGMRSTPKGRCVRFPWMGPPNGFSDSALVVTGVSQKSMWEGELSPSERLRLAVVLKTPSVLRLARQTRGGWARSAVELRHRVVGETREGRGPALGGGCKPTPLRRAP